MRFHTHQGHLVQLNDTQLQVCAAVERATFGAKMGSSDGYDCNQHDRSQVDEDVRRFKEERVLVTWRGEIKNGRVDGKSGREM